MKVDIDYIHWNDERVQRCEFQNAVFESLSPSSMDMFIKRMDAEFPGFASMALPSSLFANISALYVLPSILEKYDLESLKERAEAFSYTCSFKPGNKLVVFRPERTPSELPLDDKYIHISPASTLDIQGIRCKGEGKIESYPPRIYLRPFSSVVDPAAPPDDMYAQVKDTCSTMARMFNAKYMQMGLIDRPQAYYIYLVSLPEAFPRYKDPSYEKPSIYVENNIPPANVVKIGVVEPD